MSSICEQGPLANLPAEELLTSLQEFMTPVLAHLPKRRLRQVSVLAIRGILAAQSPVLTAMARGGQPEDALNWPLAKRSTALWPTPVSITATYSRVYTALPNVPWPARPGRSWWWPLIPSTSKSPTRRTWRASRPS